MVGLIIPNVEMGKLRLKEDQEDQQLACCHVVEQGLPCWCDYARTFSDWHSCVCVCVCVCVYAWGGDTLLTPAWPCVTVRMSVTLCVCVCVCVCVCE